MFHKKISEDEYKDWMSFFQLIRKSKPKKKDYHYSGQSRTNKSMWIVLKDYPTERAITLYLSEDSKGNRSASCYSASKSSCWNNESEDSPRNIGDILSYLPNKIKQVFIFHLELLT